MKCVNVKSRKYDMPIQKERGVHLFLKLWQKYFKSINNQRRLKRFRIKTNNCIFFTAFMQVGSIVFFFFI